MCVSYSPCTCPDGSDAPCKCPDESDAPCKCSDICSDRNCLKCDASSGMCVSYSPCWTIEPGTNPAVSIFTAKNVSLKDVSISMDFDINTSLSIGIITRYTGPGDNNMYYGQISRDQNNIFSGSIWKNVNNEWIQIASQRDVSSFGLLKLNIIGSDISLYLNNRLIVSAIDSSIRGRGKIGYMIYEKGAQVNSFTYQTICEANRGSTTFCSSDTIICNGVESPRDPKNNCGCPCLDISSSFVSRPPYTIKHLDGGGV